MTPNGQIAIPLETAAIREPFVAGRDRNVMHSNNLVAQLQKNVG